MTKLVAKGSAIIEAYLADDGTPVLIREGQYGDALLPDAMPPGPGIGPRTLVVHASSERAPRLTLLANRAHAVKTATEEVHIMAARITLTFDEFDTYVRPAINAACEAISSRVARYPEPLPPWWGPDLGALSLVAQELTLDLRRLFEDVFHGNEPATVESDLLRYLQPMVEAHNAEQRDKMEAEEARCKSSGRLEGAAEYRRSALDNVDFCLRFGQQIDATAGRLAESE